MSFLGRRVRSRTTILRREVRLCLTVVATTAAYEGSIERMAASGDGRRMTPFSSKRIARSATYLSLIRFLRTAPIGTRRTRFLTAPSSPAGSMKKGQCIEESRGTEKTARKSSK